MASQKAVIFDMDGLMIDSEGVQSVSIEKLLREHGAEPRLNDLGIIQTIGMRASVEDLDWSKIQKLY